MNIFNSRLFAVTVVPVAFWAALVLSGASKLLAEPMTFRASDSGQRVSSHDMEFARRVENAINLLRKQAGSSPTCLAYFEQLGVDLGDWLAPGSPPYIVPRKLDFFSRGNTRPVCGGAQSRPPFELIFIDKRCFRHLRVCDLASLLLHELGHLARRDTRDNEPSDFFAGCRLSTCIDPARYY